MFELTRLAFQARDLKVQGAPVVHRLQGDGESFARGLHLGFDDGRAGHSFLECHRIRDGSEGETVIGSQPICYRLTGGDGD
jgi:hypothetical protein